MGKYDLFTRKKKNLTETTLDEAEVLKLIVKDLKSMVLNALNNDLKNT